MSQFLYNLSKVLAHSAVYESWMETPVEASNFDFSSNNSKQSSKFSRAGTTTNTKTSNIPDFLRTIITNNVNDSAIPTSLAGSQNNFLSGLLTRDYSNVLNGDKLTSTMNIDPTTFTGSSQLAATAARDPFSSDFESQTANRYADQSAQALATIRSGPDAVRGGQARVGIAQGEAADKLALNRTDEIRRAQVQDNAMQNQAAQIMAAIESGRRALIVGAQDQQMKQYLGGEEHGIEAARSVDSRRGINTGNTALAARELGSEAQTIVENLTGKGNQSGSSSGWNAGITCCFIFMEALNGELPWYVRRGRDIFQTPERRVGYVRMSKWLVPLMRRRSGVKRFVNFVLIKPFLKLGAWYFAADNAKSRWRLYEPYCRFWFRIWDFLGKKG